MFLGTPTIGEAMTVKEIKREQAKSLPREDLAPYAGQWVALREGVVVAADLNPVSLRDNPAVQASDALQPVPTHSTGAFIY